MVRIIIFSKKLSRIINKIIIGLILLLITLNIILLSYSSTKSAQFISQIHFNALISNIDSFGTILKTVAENIADNENIIELLDTYRTLDSYSEEAINTMQNKIETFEETLNILTFIKTVNIVSFPGEYLFSNKSLSGTLNLTERPWFKPEFLTPETGAFISDIYKDLASGRYTISIIKYIYSQDTLLGSVILDVFIEDFLNPIDHGFYLGTLNTYIDLGNNTYMSKTGVITANDINKKENIVFKAHGLDKKLNLVFSYNKSSFIFVHEMRKFNITISLILIFCAIVLYIILTNIIYKYLNPLMTSLDKLKILLQNLEKNNFKLELTDEFEQLEFVSEALSKSLDNKIQSLIYYDDLTSLPNRKMLLKLCNELIKNHNTFALIFIDLNNFKYINDMFGHLTGDALLKTFSNTLKDLIDPKGIVTRYSGDEFVIIYKDYINEVELLTFYNSIILTKFKEPLFFADTNSLVQFSAGVAIYPKDGVTYDELIRKSDFMMYRSKKLMLTNNLMFFNDQLYNEIKRIEDIKLHLKNGIKKNEFKLLYQPIIDKDEKVKKVEALLRWNSEALGIVSPVDFIPYAEEIGEIIPIGYWIIEEISKTFSSILQRNNNLQVNINVSPLQLMDINFVHRVKDILEHNKIKASSLCFEITESVVLAENTIVYSNLHALHNLGINIALDDFGTGYASFSYLNKYELDVLKIDKTFITNPQSKYFNMVENIKNIAHEFNMTVVIEGVETPEQFDKLSSIGCDYFQGYYFSKPIPFDKLMKMLEN